MTGLGTHHHQIATTNPDAQKFFDQGFTLVYGFNHEEAVRFFQRAADLDPNAAINGQYVAYNVETKDGRSLTGVIAEENAAGMVIAMGNGIREVVKRAEIESVTTSKLSLMPEGLEETCSPQELADVIAFVGWAVPSR